MQPTRQRIEQGIYQRLDGKGVARGLEITYKDSDGKTRRRSIDGGLEQARDALASARVRRVQREREPNDPRQSFADVCDSFEAIMFPAMRENSRVTYRSAIIRLRAEFGGKRISVITRLDVRTWVNKQVAEGLKANTISTYLSIMNRIYTFAREDLELAVTMPKLKVSERPADDSREHRILSDSELAEVLTAFDSPFGLYFRFIAETGCRASEALGLTAQRVGNAEVTFREQLGPNGELVALKTRNSRRTVEVRPALAAELKLAADGRVFDLTYSIVAKEWTRVIGELALDPAPTIHDLRHAHVSGLIADGWDPADVASRIGDTLATTLKVYAHEFDSRRRSAHRLETLEARYGKMATESPLSPVITGDGQSPNVPNLRAIGAAVSSGDRR